MEGEGMSYLNGLREQARIGVDTDTEETELSRALATAQTVLADRAFLWPGDGTLCVSPGRGGLWLAFSAPIAALRSNGPYTILQPPRLLGGADARAWLASLTLDDYRRASSSKRLVFSAATAASFLDTHSDDEDAPDFSCAAEIWRRWAVADRAPYEVQYYWDKACHATIGTAVQAVRLSDNDLLAYAYLKWIGCQEPS